ncbi:hypothetical protein [Derxia lacustris]|uniref:hypothetical protein n=1 Tax=Derxia lacustris TaxID=764842 RepID=UPI00111BD01F|nr:hypothetical protein [Derxia lacustris]
MASTDYTTLASSLRPADTAAERWVRLTIGKRGPLYRAHVHDSGASGKPEASALDHTWQLALVNMRDRASARGIATDAEGAALLAEAIAECEAAMTARGG